MGSALKSIFFAGFLSAFALVLVVAGFYPLPAHVRYVSETIALPNGGRQETFTIELPSDRIALPKFARTAPYPRQGFSPDGQERVTAEMYRLRNSTGTVIGIASKMIGRVPGAAPRSAWVSDWILLLPSRGALLLNQINARRTAQATTTTPNEVQVTAGPGPGGAGVLIRGTDEFAGLIGTYNETLRVEDIDAGGVMHGHIKLVTRLEKEL